jgi:signal peptidase II
MRSYRRGVIFVALFFCTTGFDQASKDWAHGLPAGTPVPVISGVWDWQLSMNKGVAFSTFTDLPHAQILLSLLAAVMLAGIGYAAWKARPEERLKRVALAMIAGGALGNLIDRIKDGAVTDFIRWRAGDHIWPIFNVADAALLVGVVLLLFAGTGRAVRPPLRETSA